MRKFLTIVGAFALTIVFTGAVIYIGAAFLFHIFPIGH